MRFFSHKPKTSKSTRDISAPIEQWEVVQSYDDGVQSRVLIPSRSSSLASLPPGASPPLPSPPAPRSPSPYSIPHHQTNKPNPNKDRDSPQPQQVLRKKPQSNPPVALGILRALDPSRQSELAIVHHSNSSSDERFISSDSGHTDKDAEKREKRGFWGGSRESQRISDKDRGRENYRKDDAVLTRYLTATSSEDWGLVLEVCERASTNEVAAKEAANALRREFKYGEPAAQLSAARLWAIMLRNCSGLIAMHTSSRKFISTLEELITSSRTSPVVRERLVDVIAAAAFASGQDSSFRILWRKVKPADKPDEGIPFDADDSVINPSTNSKHSQSDIPQVALQHASPVSSVPVSPAPPPRHRKSPTRNRIIPPEEDMRRLFQECDIAIGNAALLSDALAVCRPEKLKTDAVIKEFFAKCRSSQELIYAQIPWASAGAERSRQARSQALQTGQLADNDNGQTREEKLLASLLKANEDLISALRQHEDIERVALERRTEDLSRKMTRIDPRHMQYSEGEALRPEYAPSFDSTISSRSPSPSLRSDTPPYQTLAHPQPFHHSRSQSSLENGSQVQLLAPPPAAPHGPRSPQISMHSRTSSPGTPLHDQARSGNDVHIQNGMTNMHIRDHRPQAPVDTHEDNQQHDEEEYTPIKPSAKALGKRRLVESVILDSGTEGDPDMYKTKRDSTYSMDDERPGSDAEDDGSRGWTRPVVKYVYDAAAERTQQRIRDATAALTVNGVD
ncbi:hypothetical protein AMATHDRAFT_75881 [Amanita thiersii Skay4041]|uniref:VHS domain-containing protein n=1 Tax=Amanita thiersii Skay4041 TaxID=703135 RepID=A0A2A9NQP6_9AGAR|nr:hypothetical protein AMATHDRAFT_75881 [Amanita thiersii Skay4041]